jgi:hypothetical protein
LKALIDSTDRLIVLIRIVLYRRSLAVYSNSGHLGCLLGGLDPIRFGDGLISRLWFDSIDRLNRSCCSLAGRSNGCRLVLPSSGSGDRRLVLATVVWFWPQSSSYRSGASLSRKDIRKEGQRWHLGVQGVCKGTCRGCREYSGDPMVLGTI